MGLDYNYKIEIAYDGSKYQGWQQLGGEHRKNTIQGILADVLSDFCKESVNLIGASRTDAKVHAKGQVANFHTNRKLQKEDILSFNQSLPPDIQVLSLKKVPKEFHSRYSALGKQYQYQIYCKDKPTPFLRHQCLFLEGELDISAMREASKVLIGKYDFAGFASQMNDKRSTVKTITEIEITKQENLIIITYEGEGFLYHMLRIITGTLIEIGLHKRTLESLKEIIRTGNRSLAGPTVEGKGLCLTKIYYKNI